MRPLILIALATTAAAPVGVPSPPDPNVWMQQELDRQHAISQDNRMMALEAQLRTEQAIRQLEAQRSRPALPQPAAPDATPSATAQPKSPYASIPDDRLAASNARVRAIAGR